MKATAPQAFAVGLARQVRKLRREYRARLERCRRKFSEPAVHELRIVTRRMLAVTDLLAALHVGEGVVRIRRMFKRRLDAFSALRDVQVQRERFETLRQQYPVVCKLDRWLRKQERKQVKKLRHDVKSLRNGRLDRWLKAVAKELVQMDYGTTRELVPRVSRAATRAFARVAVLYTGVRADRPATIHRLRIAFKHHRYLCEVLQPLLPRGVDVNLKTMRRFQNLMGDIQDCEVMLAGIMDAKSAGQFRPATVADLQQAVLRQRTGRIKTFLDKARKLRKFQPKLGPQLRNP